MTIATVLRATTLSGLGLALAGCVTTTPDPSGPPPTFNDLYDAGYDLYQNVEALADTTAGQIPMTTGTTSYNGYFSAVGSSAEYVGQVNIDAAFASNTITGSIYNVVSSAGPSDPDVYFTGSVPILNGQIMRVAPGSFGQVSGTFAGNVTLAGTSGTFSGTMNGDFQGPTAAGIVGQMSGNLSVGSVNESLSAEYAVQR